MTTAEFDELSPYHRALLDELMKIRRALETIAKATEE
jgi:hypothetical protein